MTLQHITAHLQCIMACMHFVSQILAKYTLSWQNMSFCGLKKHGEWEIFWNWRMNTILSNGSPQNLCGWCTNTSWRRSDAQNGQGQCRNDTFDAIWHCMAQGSPMGNLSQWVAPKLTHREWLTVRQLTHSWHTDSSKTCVYSWICPRFCQDLPKIAWNVQTSTRTVQWMAGDAKGRPRMYCVSGCLLNTTK